MQLCPNVLLQEHFLSAEEAGQPIPHTKKSTEKIKELVYFQK